jgi:hypothetical protein
MSQINIANVLDESPSVYDGVFVDVGWLLDLSDQ